MATILVTGASGFVSSWTVPSLLEAGHDIVALVRTPTTGDLVLERLPAAWRSRVEPRVGDVIRPASLAPALAGVDAVLHLAAIPRDHSRGADLRLVNTEGTRAVVEAMRAAGVRRLVHMSAMGVEDVPDLHYASSKAKAEVLVTGSDLDWTILKPSLQFGPGDGFFNIVADLARLSPGIIPVPGDGRSRFQPIHVGDVARVVAETHAKRRGWRGAGSQSHRLPEPGAGGRAGIPDAHCGEGGHGSELRAAGLPRPRLAFMNSQ